MKNGLDERKRLDAQNTPTGGPTSDRSNALMLEAALCQSAKLGSLDRHFDERTLDAAHSKFKGQLGVERLVLEAARKAGFTGWRLRENHREALQLAFSTADISGILSNVANKFLLQGYGFVEDAWRKIAKITPVSDFKQITSYRLVAGGSFQQVGPTGTIKHGKLSDESYTNQAKTYGEMLVITREHQINDDLGALTTLPQELGRKAALKLNSVFWADYVDNTSFFTAARGNFDDGADSVFSISGLTAAEILFAAMTDGAGDYVGSEPRVILVPKALENAARQLMVATELRDTTASTKYPVANPHAGKYSVVSSRYLTSALKWYLLADPMDIATAEVVFLNGQETPTVETADADFNTLGIQMRGVFDFGVAKQDWRGGVAMKGEA